MLMIMNISMVLSYFRVEVALCVFVLLLCLVSVECVDTKTNVLRGGVVGVIFFCTQVVIANELIILLSARYRFGLLVSCYNATVGLVQVSYLQEVFITGFLILVFLFVLTW